MSKYLRRPSTDKVDTFFMNDIDVSTRSIHIFGDIDDVSVSKILKGVQVLLASNKEEAINLYICSDGGDAYGGLFLYDYIRMLDVHVRTHACGKVFSAATLIFLAGDERIVYDNSVFMFHTVSTYVEGKSFDVNIDGKECQELHWQLCSIYEDTTNISKKQWDKLIKHEDKYIRKPEALKLGIATKEVIDEK